MCGIAGSVTRLDAESAGSELRSVLTTMAHRGPDHRGSKVYAPTVRPQRTVALGTQRLSIIDLSDAGHQPMTSQDGRFTIALNGEIYNYRELRAELQALDRVFRSESDTEVLLQACETWGPATALSRITGMFAFALYDLRDRRLFLARDQFGIKPLFFAVTGDERFVFASEIRALLTFSAIPRTIHARRLSDYALDARTDDGLDTLLVGVHQLPAAHYLDLPIDEPPHPTPQPYWRIEPSEQPIGLHDAVDQLRGLFQQSMRLHLRSDAPIGFALSGGLDSSAIVMEARRQLGDDVPLHTFSYVAEDPRLSEEPYMQRIGTAANTTQHRFGVQPHELMTDFGSLIESQGEPFANPVIFLQYYLFRLARDAGIRVMLVGQGADEMLGGYDRFVPARMASLLRTGHPLQALALAQVVQPASMKAVARTCLSAVRIGAPTALTRLISRSRRVSRLTWLDRAWCKARGVGLAHPGARVSHAMLKDTMLDALCRHYLPALLRYEDRNAMACSIENRVPFLTPTLAQFLFSLPERYLIDSRGRRKAVLRKALKGLVPDAVLSRTDKVGFTMPIVPWLLTLEPWVTSRLGQAGAIPAVDGAQLQRMWSAVRKDGSATAANAVWRALCLSEWTERYDVTFS